MRNLISYTLMLLAVASVAQAVHAQDGKQLRERDQQFLGCPTYIATAQQPRNVSTGDLNRAPVHACRYDCEKPAAAALQLDRNNPLTLCSLGRAYLDSGELERAEEAFTRAIALNPDLPLAYFNRGVARVRLGDPCGADADFRRTLELDPTAEQARYELGRLRTH